MVYEMNEKQKRFVDEYIIHANVYRAAINAGYSENYARTNASKLLAKDSIKDYKDKRLEEMKNKRTADAQEVMEYLTSVMRGEMKDETLLVVPTGDFESEVQRHDQRADTSQRTKAAELLGKRYAMWTDKQITDTTERITIVNDLDE